MEGFEPMYTGARGAQRETPAEVIVVNFNMSFANMVVVMIKLAIAAIPAAIVVFMIYFMCAAFMAGFLMGVK